jgi:pSer/pThr/pTyr-binding forkhead associated (FHA) protein
LNSTNGVFIRSKRVKQHVLADGDIIQLGEHKLIYRDMRGSIPQGGTEDDDEEELDDADDHGEEEEDEEEFDEQDESDEEELDERKR